jgi:spore germination protein
MKKWTIFTCASLVLLCLLGTAVYVNAKATIHTSSSKQEITFRDIESSYAKMQIVELHKKGIVQGTETGLYEPYKSITRAEFITMISRALHIDPLKTDIAAFHDVPKSAWEYPWVQAGTILGIVNGKSHDKFEPSAPVSRQEAATLLIRALKKEKQAHISLPFKDAQEITSWAISSVGEAQRMGLMNGYKGVFRPADSLTRQEIAVIMDRLLSMQKNIDLPVLGPASEIQLGWQYQETGEQFKRRVESTEMLNTLSPRWFFLDKQGNFSNSADSSFVTWAHDRGYKVWPLVGNRFDREATSHFLNNENLLSSGVKQLVNFAISQKVDGLNIDFENIDAGDRDKYTLFIQYLGKELKKEGIVLSVDVPPDLGTDWSDPYDYAKLGEYADFIVLMGYDEHWTGGPRAGSVSSYPWLEKSVDRLIAYIPANKLIVGLPLYTRAWHVKNGKILSKDLTIMEQSNQLQKLNARLSWDPVLGQYVTTYKQNQVDHKIWVEESRSLALKYRMALEKQTAGVAYWYVGGETADIWKSLRNVQKFFRQP